MDIQQDFEGSAEFLTAKEVGQKLRLPVSTVYYLAKSGELPAFRIGRSWRFRALEMERLAGGSDRSPSSVISAG